MESKLPIKLLKLRKHYNLTQAFVAKQLDVTPIEYMGFENGRTMCNIDQLKALAKLYDISLDEMILNDDNVVLHEVEKDVEVVKFSNDIKQFEPINNDTKQDLTINKTMVLDKKQIKTIDNNNEKPFKLNINSKVLYVIGALIVLFFIGSLLIPLFNNEEIDSLNLNTLNSSRLHASNKSVVYVSESGKVYGQGDNSNGQLNTSNFTSVVKVQEGANYTVILKRSGKVDSVGLKNDIQEELLTWESVVDIASGNGHVVGLKNDGTLYCTGDKTAGQCLVDDWNNIKNVFAFNQSTIAITNENKIKYAGDITYKTYLEGLENIQGVALSNNIVALLKQDGTVECVGGSKFNGCNTASWQNIIQIAAGDGFVAGVDNVGKVYIDIKNLEIEKEINSWSNIISIASGEDYLVGFDGDNIYGAGNNAYNQFSQYNDVKTNKLANPTNLEVNATSKTVVFTWDNVANAGYYNFEIDLDNVFSANIDKPTISIDITKFIDGKEYEIKITSLSKDPNYEDSDTINVKYTYFNTNEVPIITPTPSSSPIVVPIKYTIGRLIDLSVDKFETYLKGIGAVSITGSEDETVNCATNEIRVVSVQGVVEGEKITDEELKNRVITYTYCKYQENLTPTPTPTLTPTPTPNES